MVPVMAICMVIAMALFIRFVYLWLFMIIEKNKRNKHCAIDMAVCFIISWIITAMMFEPDGIGYACCYMITMFTIAFVPILLIFTLYALVVEEAMDDDDNK